MTCGPWTPSGVPSPSPSRTPASGRRSEARPRGADQGVAAGVLLPAPVAATSAQPPVGDQAQVSELGPDAVGAALQSAPEHDAPADAGSDRDHDQIGVPRPAPNRNSPHAAAFASFSMTVGRPTAFRPAGAVVPPPTPGWARRSPGTGWSRPARRRRCRRPRSRSRRNRRAVRR